MKLLNTATIEALDNQAAALLETQHELANVYNVAEAEIKKTQAAVTHMENHPELYADAEADAIYAKHDAAMDAFNKAEAELNDVFKMLVTLEDIVHDMKEFNSYYENRA